MVQTAGGSGEAHDATVIAEDNVGGLDPDAFEAQQAEAIVLADMRVAGAQSRLEKAKAHVIAAQTSVDEAIAAREELN